MKKSIYGMLTVGMLLFLQAGNAQITIRESNVVEKAVLRPTPFDSLTNFLRVKRLIDYKKYIGYKLYYLPKAKNYVSKYTEDPKDSHINLYTLKGNSKGAKVKTPITLNAGAGNYFTILDILVESGENYIKLENGDDPKGWISLKVILLNNSTKDTAYWEVSTFNISDENRYVNMGRSQPFMLVPYFEKQQKMYQNVDLIAVKDLRDIVDINTGAQVNIKSGEMWHCYDVTLIDSKDHPHLQGYVFLRKGDNEIMFRFGEINESMFISKQEHEHREYVKKQKEEDRVREAQERERLREQKKQEFKQHCISKWGEKLGGYIAANKVILGMDKEMCEAAWGRPYDISRTIVKGLTLEQWVYGWGIYLHFENGILTVIQN